MRSALELREGGLVITQEQLTRDGQDFPRLAEPLNAALASLESSARKECRTLPVNSEVQQVTRAFWDLMTQLRGLPIDVGSRQMLHREVHRWLLRSRYWHRAIVKPRGYAGDYRMAEMMYDLEDANCQDPARGAIENCLDRLFATVHGVRAVWERRRVFRDVVLAEAWELDRPVRVLDVGCGGARYLVDAARAMPDPVRLQVTLIDKDPAALVHAEKHLRTTGTRVRALCRNVQRLELEELPEGEYDVVLSSGLFDYLPDAEAQRVLCVMETASAPHGIVAICNFSPADPSRVVNDWVVDWPRIYRDEAAMKTIWPYGPEASVSRSSDGGLLYASRRW